MTHMPRERKDPLTPSSRVLPTTESGLEDSEMGSESRDGQTVLSMKENGKTTEPTVKENSSILTEMCMMVSGSMIRQMATEFITISMGLSTKDIGKMTCSTERARSPGLMDLSMRGQYFGGKKHGVGIYSWNDGSKY
jgi:hypothetical protein